MSRPTFVPYHQNAYDLLGLTPATSAEAVAAIEAVEAEIGRLPESVREWLLALPGLGPVGDGRLVWSPPHELPWGREDHHLPVLTEWPTGDADTDDEWVNRWHVGRSCNDPPVHRERLLDLSDYDTGDWPLAAPSFTAFVWAWAVRAAERSDAWACSPVAPLRPAVLDFLFDRLGEPEVTVAGGSVVRYEFPTDVGRVRVTADHPDWPHPHAVWWAEAADPGRLLRLFKLLRPWAVFGGDARRWTDPPADPFADA